MTYNIHSGIGRDGRYELKRTIQIIKQERPDIVALQEVDRNVQRSRCGDQSQLIADNLHMHHVYCVNRYIRDGDCGVATLSRFPIANERKHDLTFRAHMEPRVTLQTDLTIRKGQLLHVFNVHLGLRRRERHYQCERLLSSAILLNQSLHSSVLVLGDFNDRLFSVVRSKLQRRFVDAFDVAGNEAGSTFRWGPIKLRLDHIYVSRRLYPQGSYVVDTPLSRIASDHMPLVAIVEVELPRESR